MPEFTNHDRERLDEIHSIVTNGLRDNVKKLIEQYEHINKALQYINTDEWHDKSCPVIRARRSRRISWDRLLTIGVGVTAILSSVVTAWALIIRG